MAINILTEPTDPPIAGDFTLDQAIQHAAETPQLSILTTWESTGAAPAAKQGAFIRHAGNTFQVQASDEAISGSVTAGLNYVIATESAGVITLAWATTLAGYSYNPAYAGIYDSSGNQALRDLCYLDGSDYLRGMSFGEDFNTVYLADGSIVLNGGITMAGVILPSTKGSVASFSLGVNATRVFARGIWLVTKNSSGYYQSGIGGGDTAFQSCTLFSDGTVVFQNKSTFTQTYYYRQIG